jgi:hypothetical protein
MQRADMNIAKAFNPTPFPPASMQAEPDASLRDRKHWDAVLYDGQSVLIRQIRKQDLELERQFIDRLSPNGVLQPAGRSLISCLASDG